MNPKFQIGDRVVTLDGNVGNVQANIISGDGVDVVVKLKMRRTISEAQLHLADETTAGKLEQANAANVALIARLNDMTVAAREKAKPAKKRAR